MPFLSDPAFEEALYDSRALRQFARVDLGRESVPNETTIFKLRQLGMQTFPGDIRSQCRRR